MSSQVRSLMLDPDHNAMILENSTISHKMYERILSAVVKGILQDWGQQEEMRSFGSAVMSAWGPNDTCLQGRTPSPSAGSGISFQLSAAVEIGDCINCGEPPHLMPYPYWNCWHPVTRKGMTGVPDVYRNYLGDLGTCRISPPSST